MKSNTSAANGGNNGQTKSPAPIISRILSGSVGSIVYVLALTPLEVVKVRQQAGSGIGATSGSGNAASSTLLPTTTLQSAQRSAQSAAQSSSSSSVRAFRRIGRGGAVVVLNNNGLMLPKSAFPCLVAPQYYRVVAGASSRTTNITNMGARVFESTLVTHIIPFSRPTAKPGTGIMSTLLSIAKTEGRAGLYAGLRPSLLVAVPNTAIYFTAYDDIIAHLRRRHDAERNGMDGGGGGTGTGAGAAAKQHMYMPLVAGASARLVASVATAPLELVRTIQAGSLDHGRSILEEFRLILRTNGPTGLYKGLGPMILRDVPFSAIYFLGFESFKESLAGSARPGAWGAKYYRDRGAKAPMSVEFVQSLASGAAAGAIATVSTTPFDVVKTRRQAALEMHGSASSRGTLSYMRRIVKREGLFAGLWKGNQTRMVKVVPGHAIMIACYEFGKRFLEDA